MGVDIQVTYLGDQRCEAVHGPSGTKMITDSPEDIGGKGESFSPTDLVPTSLAACILTTIAISADKHGVDVRGMKVDVQKEMIADPRRRIARIPAVVTMCTGIEEKHRGRFEKIAHTCPVHRSLGDDVDAPIEFIWPD